jgi:hypothetical protein
MQKKIFGKFIWKIATASFVIVQTALNAIGTNAAELEITSQTGGEAFLVAPQDLFVDQGDILMDVNGSIYDVYSLEKSGSRWIARGSPHGTCAWGHPLCAHCGMCHIRICPLYQTRCSDSE